MDEETIEAICPACKKVGLHVPIRIIKQTLDRTLECYRCNRHIHTWENRDYFNKLLTQHQARPQNKKRRN